MLESSGRYEVYRTFKSALEKEQYLEVIQNQQIRKAFTRFRLGISQILTHKLWYRDGNAVRLRCPLCNSETENEVHLLATCAWYDTIHQKYLLMILRFSGTSACMLLPRNTVPVYLPCSSSSISIFSMPYV